MCNLTSKEKADRRMNVINLFDTNKNPIKITNQDIVDFVEATSKMPVIQHQEKIEKFHRCMRILQELVPLLDDAKVKPIMSDPTFHHQITVEIVCKSLRFEGKTLELLKEAVRECNVFGVNITSGERKFRIEFGVTHVWEVANV